MPAAIKLTPQAITDRLAAMPEWEVRDGALARTFRFKGYLAGIDFVVAVARAAEAMNHHPDLHVGWRKVGVTLSTHSAGGITELDFELADKMSALHDPEG